MAISSEPRWKDVEIAYRASRVWVGGVIWFIDVGPNKATPGGLAEFASTHGSGERMREVVVSDNSGTWNPRGMRHRFVLEKLKPRAGNWRSAVVIQTSQENSFGLQSH